jgi:hypothetical protein
MNANFVPSWEIAGQNPPATSGIFRIVPFAYPQLKQFRAGLQCSGED